MKWDMSKQFVMVFDHTAARYMKEHGARLLSFDKDGSVYTFVNDFDDSWVRSFAAAFSVQGTPFVFTNTLTF